MMETMVKGNPKKAAAVQQITVHPVQLGPASRGLRRLLQRRHRNRLSAVIDSVESRKSGIFTLLQNMERIQDGYIKSSKEKNTPIINSRKNTKL